MISQAFRRVAYRLAPRATSRFAQWYHQQRRNRKLAAKAKALRHSLAAQQDLDAMVELVLQSGPFRPSQQKAEIVALLRLLRELQPTYVCEIGSYRGGTLALFCQVVAPNARILAVDFNFKPEQLSAFRHFARARQRITLLKGDSHAPETLEQARRWLGSQQFDFLFIDGDHSLDGVTRDYEMYAPLVRQGGVVAFHDIVPDYRTRFGTKTRSFTGDVPEFWARLKRDRPDVEEFIADPEQDGFGIGVLRRDGLRDDSAS